MAMEGVAQRWRGLVLVLSAVVACGGPGPGGSAEPCPFNPAVAYVVGRGILADYDVTGFGTACEWDPERDQGRDPTSFLGAHTREMLDWMHELDEDPFYTHDQVQSLETRFGDGMIDPEAEQRVTRDTGRANQDELLASQDFYRKAKELHAWAVANAPRAASIKPEHYRNFNAWSIRLYGWPFQQEEFAMPTDLSLLEVTGLEPSQGLGGFTPVNWSLGQVTEPDYQPQNFIGLEALILGREDWLVCSGNVENNRAGSQNFNPNGLYLLDTFGNDIPVLNMLYSEGEVVDRRVAAPTGTDYEDMTFRIRYRPSATLIDLGEDGYLDMVMAHVSGQNGNMDDARVPSIGDRIAPRAQFVWLNTQRPIINGDFQGYIPRFVGIEGPSNDPDDAMVQHDMFFQGYAVGESGGWNDPRANRHDAPVNYATTIGNRSIFSPCAADETRELIHEPSE